MPLQKTQIEFSEVEKLLKSIFSTYISNFIPIKAGELSQAFYFDANKSQYVIRVNTSDESFKKDTFAYDHFNSMTISIPKIIKIGTIQNTYHYAISERALGKTIDILDRKINESLLPILIKTLETIHTQDISFSKGFGKWDIEGVGRFTTWKEAMIDFKTNPYFQWEQFYIVKKDDKNFIDSIFRQLESLISYLPEERKLIHGDFGFNNLVSDGKRITGVLDWCESKYGDPVYDIAWLDLWSDTIRYGEVFRNYYLSQNNLPKNYYERVSYYRLKKGLESLALFAVPGREGDYIYVKKKLNSILDNERLE